jgi:hypothetical protein
VTVDPATDIEITRDSGLQTITVVVTYRHTLLFGLFEAWGNGGQLTAGGTATMPMVQVFGGTPPPVNTPPPTGTPVPTNTPTATNTPTITPTVTRTPCPLDVSPIYAEQAVGTGNLNTYVRVFVTDRCTGAPVTGATVLSSPSLNFTDQGGGYYRSCNTKIPSTGSITVTVSRGSQSGSAAIPVTTPATAGCH